MITKTVRGLILLLAAAGAVVVFLVALNRLPILMQKDLVQRYDSIEAANRTLGLERVLVPAYFPSGISWPPSLVVAQKHPFKAVAMEFGRAGADDPALVIIQSAAPGGDRLFQRITLTSVSERAEYRLKGHKALLEVGTCGKGQSCSRISWTDRELHHSVLLDASPFELIRIAESMIHEQR